MQINLKQTPLEKTGDTVPIVISFTGHTEGNLYMSNSNDGFLIPHSNIRNLTALSTYARYFFSISTESHKAMPERLTEHQIVSKLQQIRVQIDSEISKGNTPVLSIYIDAHASIIGDKYFISFGQKIQSTPIEIVTNKRFTFLYKDILITLIEKIYKKANIETLNIEQLELIQAKINVFLSEQLNKIILLVVPNEPLTDDERKIQSEEAKKWNLRGFKGIHESIDEVANEAKNDIEKLENELDKLIPELKELDQAPIEKLPKKRSFIRPSNVAGISLIRFDTKVREHFPSQPINASQALSALIAKELKLFENQLPIKISIFACKAGAAASMLEYFPKGSTLFMPVNETQLMISRNTSNAIRNSANFIGTDYIKFAISEPFRNVKEAFPNVSPKLALKNENGEVEIYDFQALLLEFVERIKARDYDMNTLEKKFTEQYSPNDQDFRFNHFERIIRQIGNTANKYEISLEDRVELGKLLLGKNPNDPEYVKISNNFYDTHQKIRRIRPRSIVDIDNPKVSYGIFDTTDVDFDLDYSESIFQEKLPDIDFLPLYRILTSRSYGIISLVEFSDILFSIRNQIIEKYMDATFNPSIVQGKLLIENEFQYTLKDEFKNTERGGWAQLALDSLESILRGEIPVENPLFNVRDLRDAFNESFVRTERAKAKSLFDTLRDFKNNPERYDLEDILDIRVQKYPEMENRQRLLDYLVAIDFESIDDLEMAKIFHIINIVVNSKDPVNHIIEKLRNKNYEVGEYDHIKTDQRLIKSSGQYLTQDIYKNDDENGRRKKLETVIDMFKDPKASPTMQTNVPPNINVIRQIALMTLIADKQEEILEKIRKAQARDLPSMVIEENAAAEARTKSGVTLGTKDHT